MPLSVPFASEVVRTSTSTLPPLRFGSTVSEIVVCSFVALIYIYMVRLIRDIDDPFEYEENGSKGAAEVELFPLEEFRERLGK